MRARSALAVPFLLVAILLSGCLDDVEPVYLPQAAVPDGWSHGKDNESSEAAGGNVDIIVNQYDHQGQLLGGVYLVGVTDVPFVDEGKELRNEVESYAASIGVLLTKTAESNVQLDNGKNAKRIEYDIERSTPVGTAHGKAWLLEWDAGFTAGAFGYATTERQDLLGSSQDESLWQETQQMLLSATWRGA